MIELEQQLTQALALANLVHCKQKDKAGQPYILHPLHVMHNVTTLEEKIVALLHDVVEDSELTILQLSDMGYDKYLIEAIDTLTRRKRESYAAYIDRIIQSGDKVAINVKIEDLLHNSDISRLERVEEKDLSRLNKYQDALHRLQVCRQEWDYSGCDHVWIDTGYAATKSDRFYCIHMCSKCGKREHREGTWR